MLCQSKDQNKLNLIFSHYDVFNRHFAQLSRHCEVCHFLSTSLQFYPLPGYNTAPSVSYFPRDSQVVLSLAAGSDDQVSLVQRLHHLLCLIETDVVEVGMGDHTFYICWREKECKQLKMVSSQNCRGEFGKQSVSKAKKKKNGKSGTVYHFNTIPVQSAYIKPAVILTCSLLLLFELLVLFLVFRLCVKVIICVLGELPLIGFVHQIRGAAREVNAEFFYVDFHDAAVNCHAHLEGRENRNHQVLNRCYDRRTQKGFIVDPSFGLCHMQHLERTTA